VLPSRKHSHDLEEFCLLEYNSVQPVESQNVSEEHTASIFEIEEKIELEVSVKTG
jgi:hypothetical protein